MGGGFVINEQTELSANAFYLDRRIDHAETVKSTSQDIKEAETMLPNSTKVPALNTTKVPAVARKEQKLITAALPFYNAESLLKISDKNNMSIAQVLLSS